MREKRLSITLMLTVLLGISATGVMTARVSEHDVTDGVDSVVVGAERIFTVVANPGAKASSQIRLNWHSVEDDGTDSIEYTTVGDSAWAHSRKGVAWQERCTAYDSIYSHTRHSKNFWERAQFIRNTIELNRLTPDTEYKYRVGGDEKVRYFKTAPTRGEWVAAVISDFHSYMPMPQRTRAAMAMLDTLESINGKPFDLILNAGDICAWGGSYTFWKALYTEPAFERYVWAGVIGNHDYMDRTFKRSSTEFFRNANNYPGNGYKGQEGVCYYTKYGDVLLIMLNNEGMRTKVDLERAQEWVREVINRVPAQYRVVMQHYQWFNGDSGKASEYGRWKEFFDEMGVDLAIAGNFHIYMRSYPLYGGEVTDGSKGTVYVQTSSSDNGRGRTPKEMTDNKELIAYRWSEGPKTISGILMKVNDDKISLSLYDRHGTLLDSCEVLAKREASPVEEKPKYGRWRRD